MAGLRDTVNAAKLLLLGAGPAPCWPCVCGLDWHDHESGLRYVPARYSSLVAAALWAYGSGGALFPTALVRATAPRCTCFVPAMIVESLGLKLARKR